MNTWTSSTISRPVFLVLLGLVLFTHLPLINADPDRNNAVGRGPFTDEGLNTIQVRNWINHGTLSLTECDNLLKTPLLGFPMALTYLIAGPGHAASRGHVLLLVFLALLIVGLDRRHTLLASVFALITLMQFQVHQASHFSMAEMPAAASILLAIHFLARSSDPEISPSSRHRQAVLSGIFISLSYWFKIQFIYIIPLMPVSLMVLWLRGNYLTRKLILRQGLYITGTMLLSLVIYLLAWYLPNKEAYDYMMQHQSGDFRIDEGFFNNITFNLNYHFLKGWLIIFIVSFLVLSITGIVLMFRSRSARYPALFTGSMVWLVLELHKLAMVYLPTRYQVSLYVAMGLVMSVVIAEMISRKGSLLASVGKISGIMIVSGLFFINIMNYREVMGNRTYVIRETNQKLAEILDRQDVVLGTWGPALTWESRSKALPVWNHFLNYTDPLKTFSPSVVISEADEKESEKAWTEQGIELQEEADSSFAVQISEWEVIIYFMPYL